MSIMSRRRRLLKNRIRFLKTGRAADFAFLRHVRLVDLIAFVIGIFMAPLGAVWRPRQHPQQLFCVAREGIFARRIKTNLPMCLRRCESSRLGRFAELLFTWLHLAAAEVPYKTAPFASFSGRTEKDGPARPERGPISSSAVKAIKKGNHNTAMFKIILMQR